MMPDTEKAFYFISINVRESRFSLPHALNISYTIPYCRDSQPWPHMKITWGAFKKYQDSGLTAQRVRLNRSGVELSIGVVLKSSKVIVSRVQHRCFLHTLNLKKGSPRLYSLLTLLTALQRRNRLLKLFSFYPKQPKHIAICYSPGTSFLRNINTTFPTGRKECSSPPKRNLLLSHPPRRARKQNTTGAWSAQLSPEERSQ